MTAHNLVYCTIISLALVLQAVGSQQCTGPYFGQQCKFLCRCSTAVCRSDGYCYPRVSCNYGWFGPACQYRELLSWYKNTATSSVITDDSDSTCLPGGSVTEVNVGFVRLVRFFWIRLTFDEEAGDRWAQLELTFNGRLPCTNGRMYAMSRRIVDFECDVTEPIDRITIKGVAAKYLCNVYVSGGQNLAIRQTTAQSSDVLNRTNGVAMYPSELAVDGITYGMNRCARTAISQTANHTFRLDFNVPVILRYIIMYSGTSYENMLASFSLRTVDVSNALIDVYRNPRVVLDSYFFLLKETKKSVNSIIVTTSNNTNLLEICEIETYGVQICSPGTYDFACSSNCLCSDNACAAHSGACLTTCVLGYFGLSCRNACSEYCNPPGVCDRQTGVCSGCIIGYNGSKCEQACAPGTYGFGCAGVCYNKCKDTLCNPTTGACLQCNGGFYGESCDRQCSTSCYNSSCDTSGSCSLCNPGFYGDDCSLACSLACQDNICNARTGDCLKCNDGYYGSKCSLLCNVRCKDKKCDALTGDCVSCEPGFFGIDCSNNCAGHCVNDICDLLNGSCDDGCKPGYFGASCLNICPQVCLERKCHMTTGLCLACNNFYGSYCSLPCPIVCANETCDRHTGHCLFCTKGRFGKMCSKICPVHCAMSLCDITNGTCNSCDHGYYGRFCNLKCPVDCVSSICDIWTAECVKASTEKSYAHVYVIVSILTSVLVTVIVLLWQKKKKKSNNNEENGDDTTQDTTSS